MKLIGNSLDAAVDNLIEEIKRTEVYLQYRHQKESIHNDLDLCVKIDELQALHLRLQNVPEGADLEAESERIGQRIEELCEDTRVNDYLQAEVDFCRKFQEVMAQIVQEIDLE